MITGKKASGTEPDGFDFSRFVRAGIYEHRLALNAIESGVTPDFSKSVKIIEACVRARGKILLLGTGGSPADAQHVATELVIRFKADRVQIAAIAVTTHSSSLTAGGNDLAFEQIFARQVDALARPEDVVIGISNFGDSANVSAGIATARKRGAKAVGLSSGAGGGLRNLCNALSCVPSKVKARIQEMYILIGLMLCKPLEFRLGSV